MLKVKSVVYVSLVIAGLFTGSSVKAKEKYQDTDTPVPTAVPTITNMSGTSMYGITQGATINPEWFCQDGTPVGWKTKTPNAMWDMACGQCSNHDGEWWPDGTRTLTPTVLVSPSYTPPVGTPSTTRSPTLTATPSDSYLYQVVGNITGSYFCPSTGCAGLDTFVEFVVPTADTIETVAVLSWVGNSHSASNYGTLGFNNYGDTGDTNYFIQVGNLQAKTGAQEGCFYKTSDWYCSRARSDGYLTSGADYWAAGTFSGECNLSGVNCRLQLGNHSGNTGGSMSWWSGELTVMYKVKMSSAQKTQLFVTPYNIENYCASVDDTGVGTDFGYSGLVWGEIDPEHGCFDIGPVTIPLLPDPNVLPWLAHICFQTVSMGTIVVFGLTINIDVLLMLMGIIYVIGLAMR
jgi:hypothetical protein